jgi:periplasmic divalent cation tolerance protein
MKNKFIIVETTYPNSAKGKKLAKNLAQILLEKKLAACVQISTIESCYFWQEKIVNEREILLSIKSKNSLYGEIEKTILKHHFYEIPQITAIQINQGSEGYLKWVDSNVVRRK